MRDETRRRSVRALQRPSRLRPSWRRRIASLAAVVGLCGLSAAIFGRRFETGVVDREPRCADISRTEVADTVVRVCRQEFQSTKNPKTGALLAHALSKQDDSVEEARRIATSLLTTAARADSLRVLGTIAHKEEKLDDAVVLLEEARFLHRFLQEPLGLSIADAVLSYVRSDRSEYAESLRLLDECLEQAKLISDRLQEWLCRTVAARTLVALGYFAAADAEAKKAEPLAITLENKIDLDYQFGNLAQESGHHDEASARFEKVLQNSEHSSNVSRTIIAEENLAYSLAEIGEVAEAQKHLDNATRLDRDHKNKPDLTWTGAQIAFKQGDLAAAASLTESYFELLEVGDDVNRDDHIDVESLRARIELARKDLSRAELWARRGVLDAERVRRKQSALELRPWVLTKRRAPYELQFVALARQGQVDEAALAFDRWQGRTVQDALARPRPPASIHLSDIADQITRLGPWIAAVSNAPFARDADTQSVLRTMPEIDLFALIVANDEVWRLTANHGPPRLSVVGPWTEIDERVRDLSSHPNNVAQAAALGALLLPDDTFRATSESLHVVLDGRLAELPVAALRQGTTPLIAFRPIIRHLRLPETRCARVTRSGNATVLGDPRGDLPGARIEAEQIAGLLHTTSKTGAAATKTALFAAENDAVLHVATHLAPGVDGPALELADSDVSALEILARRRAPSLVVLSSCDAVAKKPGDNELASSLIASFLASGSQHVVATLLSVEDQYALDVMKGFYRADGVRSPARALQAAQLELLGTDNKAWPQFTVFGPDVCLEDAPDHP